MVLKENNFAYIDGAKKKCSILLKRTGAPIAYLNDQKRILQIQKEKAPDGDETP